MKFVGLWSWPYASIFQLLGFLQTEKFAARSTRTIFTDERLRVDESSIKPTWLLHRRFYLWDQL
jgi:hypothetical protein